MVTGDAKTCKIKHKVEEMKWKKEMKGRHCQHCLRVKEAATQGKCLRCLIQKEELFIVVVKVIVGASDVELDNGVQFSDEPDS